MWNRNLRVRTYYSMADLLGETEPTLLPPKTSGLYEAIRDMLHFSSSDFPRDDEYTTELYQNYIWPRFYDEAICYVDNGEMDPKEAAQPILGKILAWLNATRKNYGYLIQMLEDERRNLLDPVRNSTVSNGSYSNTGENSSKSSNTSDGEINNSNKFNDTPQITASDVEGDDFVSNTNRSNQTNTSTSASSNCGSNSNSGVNNGSITSETDLTTKMARMKEIRDNIENIYQSWSDEFKKFIIW